LNLRDMYLAKVSRDATLPQPKVQP
jgi:hypothetical protein